MLYMQSHSDDGALTLYIVSLFFVPKRKAQLIMIKQK